MTILVDATRSDVSQQSTEERVVQQVLMPYAAANHDRVVLSLVNGSSYTGSSVVADVSFAFSSDNPNVVRRETKTGTKLLMAKLEAALTSTPPAQATDVFGALAWSANVLRQTDVVQPRGDVVVLISDAISTLEGCNLTVRDLSTAAVRQRVLADCATPLPKFPPGTTLWGSGAGTDPGIGTNRALDLEDLYRQYAQVAGLRFGRWGPQLLPLSPSGTASGG
jgi:hypothetical protein